MIYFNNGQFAITLYYDVPIAEEKILSVESAIDYLFSATSWRAALHGETCHVPFFGDKFVTDRQAMDFLMLFDSPNFSTIKN